MPTVGIEAGTVYYESHGDGPAVLFAHGAGGNSLTWYQQVPYFAERYRTLVLDFRGFGRSSRIGEEVEIAPLTRDLLAVLDAEDVERAALVAHNIGTIPALRTALDHPARVSCLVLSGSVGGVLTPTLVAAMSRASLRYQREGGGPESVLTPGFIARHPAQVFLLQQIYNLNRPIDPTIMARIFEVRLESEEFTGYGTPTLVIAGAKDPLFGHVAIQDAAGMIPGAKFVGIADAGHNSYFEKPDEFNRVVGEFIALHAAV